MNDVTVGDVFESNQGCKFRVVRCNNSKDFKVRFLDNYGFERTTTKQKIKKGAIKNPYYPSVCSVGYMGVGDFVSKKDGRLTKEYSTWKAIIRRCYAKESRLTNRSYKDVRVCDEWHNFQNFAEWYSSKHGDGDFSIDKDLLSPNSKVYSPENCVLIPREINSAIITPYNSLKKPLDRSGGFAVYITKENNGVYLGTFKTAQDAHQAYVVAKEAYVKEVANEWRGRIDERVYDALMNWTVNP